MYTLRTIKVNEKENGREKNQYLGDNYQIINSTSAGFKEIFEAFYNVDVYSNYQLEKDYLPNDPKCPFQGRGITGDLEYDKKFFWVDVKEVYKKGYRFYFVEGEVYFLEDENQVVLSEITRTKGFVCIGEDKVYPLLKGDENYIVTESGRTFSNLSKY